MSSLALKEIFDLVQPGDIIQLGNNANDMAHSIICYGKKVDIDGNGTASFAQNESNKTVTMSRHYITMRFQCGLSWDYPASWFNYRYVRLIRTSKLAAK